MRAEQSTMIDPNKVLLAEQEVKERLIEFVSNIACNYFKDPDDAGEAALIILENLGQGQNQGV